jgi:DNA-binding HxlR family transcriptional regulator
VQDTSPAGKTRYYELLRRLPADRRMQAMLRLSRAVRELALAGIRERYPTATEPELRVRLTVRLYGRDVAQRLFESVPADAR